MADIVLVCPAEIGYGEGKINERAVFTTNDF